MDYNKTHQQRTTPATSSTGNKLNSSPAMHHKQRDSSTGTTTSNAPPQAKGQLYREQVVQPTSEANNQAIHSDSSTGHSESAQAQRVKNEHPIE